MMGFPIQLIVKIAIAIIGFFVIMMGFNWSTKYLLQVLENTASIAGYTKRVTSFKYAIAAGRIAVVCLYIIFLFILFEIPGSTFVSFLGLFSVAVTLLIREILLDYVFGFLILLEGKIRIDDEVVVEGFQGTVEIIELRTTKIRDELNGDLLIVSNRHFTKFVKKKSQRGFAIEANIQSSAYEDVSAKIKRHYRDDHRIKKVDVTIVQYNAEKIEIQVIVDTTDYTYKQLRREILEMINEV